MVLLSAIKIKAIEISKLRTKTIVKLINYSSPLSIDKYLGGIQNSFEKSYLNDSII